MKILIGQVPEAIYRDARQEEALAIQNKTMVPTEMTAGVSTTRTLPELKRLKRKKKMKISDAMVTDDEVKILQQMYKYGVKKE